MSRTLTPNLGGSIVASSARLIPVFLLTKFSLVGRLDVLVSWFFWFFLSFSRFSNFFWCFGFYNLFGILSYVIFGFLGYMIFLDFWVI